MMTLSDMTLYCLSRSTNRDPRERAADRRLGARHQGTGRLLPPGLRTKDILRTVLGANVYQFRKEIQWVSDNFLLKLLLIYIVLERRLK